MTPTEKNSPKLSRFSPAVAVYSLALLLEKPAALGMVWVVWLRPEKTYKKYKSP